MARGRPPKKKSSAASQKAASDGVDKKKRKKDIDFGVSVVFLPRFIQVHMGVAKKKGNKTRSNYPRTIVLVRNLDKSGQQTTEIPFFFSTQKNAAFREAVELFYFEERPRAMTELNEIKV